MKKLFILTALVMCAARFAAAQYDNNPPVSRGQSELSFYGGASISTKKDAIAGQNVEYGGSGYIFGLTAVGYASEYAGFGLDLSYADNGCGSWQALPGGQYRVGITHFTPMFVFKGQPMPNSRFRLYVPLGIGFDWVNLYTKNNSGAAVDSDNAAGLALMAGLGFEADVGRDVFIGFEGRYIYSNFFGKEMAGVKDAGAANLLFKAGARFDADFLM